MYISVFEEELDGTSCESSFWPTVLCPRLQPPSSSPSTERQSPYSKDLPAPSYLPELAFAFVSIPCSYFSMISNPHLHPHSRFRSLACLSPQTAAQSWGLSFCPCADSYASFVSGLYNLQFTLLYPPMDTYSAAM